jgi:hypothetical protein
MYVFAVGRVLEAGEVFEIDAEQAGVAASDGDPGHGLLGQLGTNYELVTDPPSKTPAIKSVDAATTVNEG